MNVGAHQMDMLSKFIPEPHKRDAGAGNLLQRVKTEAVRVAIESQRRAIRSNSDKSMRSAAEGALKWSETLPNGDYAIPESTPVESARGKGKVIDQSMIEQFGEGTVFSGKDC